MPSDKQKKAASSGSARGGKGRSGEDGEIPRSAPAAKKKKAARESGGDIPRRYTLKETEEGVLLSCSEAPNINVRIVRGLSVSEANVRRARAGTVYLDGAGRGAPFIDPESQIYNLDHHEGVVRAFTLSTCEQAMVMVLRGLKLKERSWRIIANEPDLDTVLAIWVLLNHLRITDENSDLANRIMPLIRLEGVIDAHGFALEKLTGFTRTQLSETRQLLGFLREDELRIKRENRWNEVDFTRYTADLLEKIDRTLFTPLEFKEYRGVEELARVEIGAGRDAIVVSSDMGIYEMEQHLFKLYDERPGIIALQKDPETYTLRQVDMFLPFDLSTVYDRLNFLDPWVTDSENAWGGSSEIGGSPRKTGTGLSVAEITQALRETFQRRSFLDRAYHFARTALLTAGVFIGAAFGVVALQHLKGVGEIFAPRPWALTMLFPALVAIYAVSHLYRYASDKRALYGLRLPGAFEYLWAAPLALALGWVGGAWLPQQFLGGQSSFWIALCGTGVTALGIELFFRSVVHGRFARHDACMHAGGNWFLSQPALLSAFLYAAVAFLLHREGSLFDPSTYLSSMAPDYLMGAALFLASFAFGIASAAIRERAGSVAPSVLLHWAAALLAYASQTGN